MSRDEESGFTEVNTGPELVRVIRSGLANRGMSEDLGKDRMVEIGGTRTRVAKSRHV